MAPLWGANTHKHGGTDLDYQWILVWIVVGVSAALIFLWYYFTKVRKKNPKVMDKEQGAQKAVGPLRRFAASNSFRFIAPAHLAREKADADLDAILIGYFGVLAVKALGYNGEIYGGPDEKSWTQIVEQNRRSFDNPITEAAADVRVIRDALLSTGLRQIPVEVVCVFTDDKAQLALPKSTGHYTVKTFKELLRKEKYMGDCGLDLDKVEKALRDSIS